MREILFRGKRLDNGKWVYGSFIPDLLDVDNPDADCNRRFIKPLERPFCKTKESREIREVDRESVCQYTGLYDKKLRKVFEGDVIGAYDELKRKNLYGVIKFGTHRNAEDDDLTELGFYVEFDNSGLKEELVHWLRKCTVIGSIYDNPELIGDVRDA